MDCFGDKSPRKDEEREVLLRDSAIASIVAVHTDSVITRLDKVKAWESATESSLREFNKLNSWQSKILESFVDSMESLESFCDSANFIKLAFCVDCHDLTSSSLAMTGLFSLDSALESTESPSFAFEKILVSAVRAFASFENFGREARL